MIGFINLIKPKGMSSAYAVGKVKKILKCPCGHMGTLDPMASGVLPVGIGKASRLFDYMLDKEKIYVARFRFGILTDTLDTTGVIESRKGLIWGPVCPIYGVGAVFLIYLLNKFKDIEFNAIRINDMEIYFKCEKRICRLVEAMEYVRNEYMF